ncbi:substrate-binding domain-containing protein [Enemella evansiae]|uniref:substrate-binding domain-containing protein n=1 Tax=Enemella evansiae TaxID=2016499 RepID=UPI00105FC4B6|nr:substrate-binding domain-containing protein [Enemella evansiae]TDO87727.1 GntR family transcriptional regulator [Enemella evansiae]
MPEPKPSLLAPARRAKILDALALNGAVRISELSAELGASSITLRRDLAQLERAGRLVRVHGGAVPAAAATSYGVSLTSNSAKPPRSLGVLLPSLENYWPQVVSGMRQHARALGWELVVRSASYELQDERPLLTRLMESGDIRGLIVAPNSESAHAQEVIDFLAENTIPSVLIEREGVTGEDHTPLESVVTDHGFGAILAARHLARLGHRKVGLVVTSDSPTSRKIFTGWQQACADLDLTPTDHFESEFPPLRDPRFADELQAVLERIQTEQVTGLLVHSDHQAMALADLALSQGISLPEDLSIVAYDDVVAENFTPALTAVCPPRSALGAAAVDLLSQRVNEAGRPVRRMTLTPSLTIRASTTAAPLNRG